jgi:5-methylcytosine-specific restriction endonuclease McrA
MAEILFDKRCGTYAGYKAHYNAKEKACQFCVDARRKYWRDRKATNKELYAAQQKNWKEANPEKYAEMHRNKSRKRRAIIRGNGSEPYTEKNIFNLYGTDCHICKQAIDLTAPRRQGIKGWEFGLHIDHIIPVSIGGSDSINNVRPAHGLCNLKKGAKGE